MQPFHPDPVTQACTAARAMYKQRAPLTLDCCAADRGAGAGRTPLRRGHEPAPEQCDLPRVVPGDGAAGRLHQLPAAPGARLTP